MTSVKLAYDDYGPSDVYYGGPQARGPRGVLLADEYDCAAVVLHRDVRYRFFFKGCNEDGCQCGYKGTWRVEVDFTVYAASEKGSLL